jgi:predicted amidohydrolase YtcJ
VAARFGLWASVVRQIAKGTCGLPFGTAEGVDIHTALRSYTARGFASDVLEDKIGTLEVGKRGSEQADQILAEPASSLDRVLSR